MNQAINSANLESAVKCSKQVKGLTHDFYKYPARFSPRFVREAIETFTEPGDLVIDPFVGGGTTAVEARALKRQCIGVDINSLAAFTSKVKTSPLTAEEICQLKNWKYSALVSMNLQNKVLQENNEWIGYQKNIETSTAWRIKKLIQLSLASIQDLHENQERFARCTILRTSQWALDSRKTIPSVKEFRYKFDETFEQMLSAIKEFSQNEQKTNQLWDIEEDNRSIILNRSSIGLEEEEIFTKTKAPKLILTSPPYPGVHVLYHRWQVMGRRETPAPYWIANELDGSGASYYTFGDRKDPKLKSYFRNTSLAFQSLAKIADSETIFVQILAFNSPDWQLPMYLKVLEKAGLREIKLCDMGQPDGRLWREVPNRKWFASQRGKTNSSQEVVLFHKLA